MRAQHPGGRGAGLMSDMGRSGYYDDTRFLSCHFLQLPDQLDPSIRHMKRSVRTTATLMFLSSASASIPSRASITLKPCMTSSPEPCNEVVLVIYDKDGLLRPDAPSRPAVGQRPRAHTVIL